MQIQMQILSYRYTGWQRDLDKFADTSDDSALWPNAGCPYTHTHKQSKAGRERTKRERERESAKIDGTGWVGRQSWPAGNMRWRWRHLAATKCCHWFNISWPLPLLLPHCLLWPACPPCFLPACAPLLPPAQRRRIWRLAYPLFMAEQVFPWENALAWFMPWQPTEIAKLPSAAIALPPIGSATKPKIYVNFLVNPHSPCLPPSRVFCVCFSSGSVTFEQSSSGALDVKILSFCPSHSECIHTDTHIHVCTRNSLLWQWLYALVQSWAESVRYMTMHIMLYNAI